MHELTIIFTGVVSGLIVIGISINVLVRQVLNHKRLQDGTGTAGNTANGQIGDIADRTDMIEDRLRVLERLATDRGQMLSDEIEALRDRQITHDKSAEDA